MCLALPWNHGEHRLPIGLSSPVVNLHNQQLDTEPMEDLRLVVVEDEPLFRDLLVGAIVSRIPGTTVVGSFATGEECLAAMPNIEADVLVTDIDLGEGVSGPNLGVELRRTTPIRGVVLLSNLALPSVLSSIPQDVSGGWAYLLKTSVSNVNQVGRAVMNAAQGNMLIDDALIDELQSMSESPLDRLTPRQFDVLSRIARGWSNKRIAEDLGLTLRSVESVISDIITNIDLREEVDGINPRVLMVLSYLENTVTKTWSELQSGSQD